MGKTTPRDDEAPERTVRKGRKVTGRDRTHTGRGGVLRALRERERERERERDEEGET